MEEKQEKWPRYLIHLVNVLLSLFIIFLDQGIMYYASSEKYEGQWNEGMPDGQGTNTFIYLHFKVIYSFISLRNFVLS